MGWIAIDGTKLNYPVMQTKNNPNFYLKRNFEKEYSDLGVPYIQENCDILNSDNLIIYGHHIKGGKMFGALESYKSKSFYEKHKTIQFDTLTEQAEYEIVAVFKTVAYSAEGYRYYDFVNAETEEAFIFFVFVVVYVITMVSVCKPARIAASVSPMEALRYVPQDGMKKTANKKLCRKLSPMGLGMMNFSKNRKKTVITMLSLALGGILFMTAATYMSSFDKENYARNLIPLTCLLTQSP